VKGDPFVAVVASSGFLVIVTDLHKFNKNNSRKKNQKAFTSPDKCILKRELQMAPYLIK
jgi:hypothetical protein